MRKERKLEIVEVLLTCKTILNPNILMDKKLSEIEELRERINSAIMDLSNDK